ARFAARVAAAFFAAAERAGSTFFAVVLLAAVFFAGAFFAGAFLRAGPFARLMASSSIARSNVISSILSPRGIVAFVSPSVTYGPKRPSLTLTGFPLTGSASNSLRALAARRAPYFG